MFVAFIQRNTPPDFQESRTIFVENVDLTEMDTAFFTQSPHTSPGELNGAVSNARVAGGLTEG